MIIDPQYHYEQVNVEAQQSNPVFAALVDEAPHRACASAISAFGRGTMEFLHPENRKILAFVRRYEDETILVVANLSRLVQCFELDLAAVPGHGAGRAVRRHAFPEIGERPYFLNLGPFAFYWFALERQRRTRSQRGEEVPLDRRARRGTRCFADAQSRRARARDRSATSASRRWFGGKARTITRLHDRATPSPLPRDAGCWR